MIRSLVIGASGFVGNILYNKLAEQVRTGTSFSFAKNGLTPLNLMDRKATNSFITAENPEIIYNCAALPNVEWAEDNIQECRAVNVEAVKTLVQNANDIGAKLVHFSTDYIFDGKQGPYSEEAKPKPINVYGQAKLDAETYIQVHCDKWLIIRITVVYGWEARGKNFINGLIKRLSNNEVFKVPNDQIGSPTYADNMLDITRFLAENNYNGIYNIAGDELMDRFTFAKIAAEVFDLDSSLLEPVSTSELQQRASRPMNAGFVLDKIKAISSIGIMNPFEGLTHMKAHSPKFI